MTRTDQLNFGMRFAWFAAVASVLSMLTGSYQNAARFVSFDQGLAVDDRVLQGLLVSAMLVLAVALTVAAGYAAAPRWEWDRWVGAMLAARGRLWTKPVGREAWNGLAAGAGLAALPYLAAAAMGDGPRVRVLEGANLLVEAWPQLEPLDGLALEWEMYAVVVFLLPWLANRVRRHSLRWAILLAAGTVLAGVSRGPFPGGHPWNFAVGLALTAGFAGIYRLAGVLGVWMAPVGMYAAVQGIRLVNMAPESMQRSGWQILTIYSGLALAALAAAIWGKEESGLAEMESMEENAGAPPRSARERLKAEFQVARRAQAGMLPGEAPEIEGFELSAVCEPAREVGGDLFDYLQFENGQWAVCVADVSGKGVPAALYMTLTKGMLAAAKHGKPDLEVIAVRLNKALTAAGKNRVFVTMSLGLLDGRRQTVRHVRAGHNPPLLWRAATGECKFLQPRGIGLGLTAGGAFERHLEEQEVSMEQGDALVMYSDGLVECMNERHEQFGEQRLEDAVRRWGKLRAAELKDRIVEDARRFRGKADPHDDLTVLVVKAAGRSEIHLG